MYGMVNRAISEFIKHKYGADTWERVASKASVRDEYVSMEQYPDSHSVDLVVALSETTTLSPAQLLTEIGEYWIEFAYNSEYGDLMDMAGDTLPEVLSNLDEMHTRVGESFADLTPPSFWISDVTEDSLILHYASEREGLAPMVVGLVRGLANLLNTECSVIQVGFRADTGGEDEFAVAFAPKEAPEKISKPAHTVP